MDYSRGMRVLEEMLGAEEARQVSEAWKEGTSGSGTLHCRVSFR